MSDINKDATTLSGILERIKDINDKFIIAHSNYVKVHSDYITTKSPNVALLLAAIINRAISLNYAYLTLAQNNNYLSAVSLVRLQLDNAMMLYATDLVNDVNDFAKYILKGCDVKGYKDINNQMLSNGYIAKQLESIVPGAKQFYKEMCAFIHLSDKFIKVGTRIIEIDGKRPQIDVSVGAYDFFDNCGKIKISNDIIAIDNLILHLLEKKV